MLRNEQKINATPQIQTISKQIVEPDVIITSPSEYNLVSIQFRSCVTTVSRNSYPSLPSVPVGSGR